VGKYLVRGTALFLLSAVFTQALLSSSRDAYAQDMPDYTPAQLQQLVAPVALYPDPLLGEVLMASTYPLEVSAAAQWRYANPGISGDYLTAAMQQEPWDPSVKGLTEFPDVLQMMNNNLDWTEKLGEAFLADQPDVMDAVQQLRHQAQMSGALVSGQQETVSDQDGDITIEPTDPAQVYVPYYNPVTVFSPWPYPAYEPYAFAAPNGVAYVNNGSFGYFTGVVIVETLWGWDRWDWHRHRIDLDDRRWRDLDNGQPPPARNEWRFEPEHRHDIPYKNQTVRTRFESASPATLRPYRGYEERAPVPEREAGKFTPPEAKRIETRRPETRQPEVRQPEVRQPEVRQPEVRQPEARQHEMRQPETRQPEVRQPEPAAPKAAPPLFESFAPRPQVNMEEKRGSSSQHAPPEARHAPPAAREPQPARNNSPDEAHKDERK